MLFILILPLLFVVLGIVVDLGMIKSSKKKVDTTVQNILLQAFETKDEKTEEEIMTEIERLITINLGTVKRNIVVEDHIYITIEKRFNLIFPFLFKEKNINYIVTYEALLDNDKIQIIRR